MQVLLTRSASHLPSGGKTLNPYEAVLQAVLSQTGWTIKDTRHQVPLTTMPSKERERKGAAGKGGRASFDVL